MTAIATTDFSPAAKLHAALHASTHSQLRVTPEPSVLHDMLGLLVGVGVFTVEQAQALWQLIDGGVGYPLPALPAAQAGRVDTYQLLRVATLVAREHGDGDEVVTAIGDAIVHEVAPAVIGAIGVALDSAGRWLSTVFS